MELGKTAQHLPIRQSDYSCIDRLNSELNVKKKETSRIRFKALNFAEHPDLLQIEENNFFAVRYQSEHAKRYSAYDSINRSLDSCLASIFFINSNRDKAPNFFMNENMNAHFTNLIICYGRCFASGRVKLEKNNVPRELISVHDRLIKLRDDYIAHNGNSGEASENLIALYPNRAHKKVVSVIAPTLLRMRYVNEKLMWDAQRLCEQLKKPVSTKLADNYKLICDEIYAADINEIYSGFEEQKIENLESTPIVTQGSCDYEIILKPNGMVHFKGKVKNQSSTA